jgi:hypothetical protein
MKAEVKAFKIEKLLFHPSSFILHPFFEPSLQYGEHVELLFGLKRVAFGNLVPFLKTAATTGRRRVLCDEDRMITHGCLLTVVGRMRRGETLLYKVCGVFEHNAKPLLSQVIQLFSSQLKATAEIRTIQSSEDFIHI